MRMKDINKQHENKQQKAGQIKMTNTFTVAKAMREKK